VKELETESLNYLSACSGNECSAENYFESDRVFA
jgi:hypothetical protein